jgi:hypothetical protein
MVADHRLGLLSAVLLIAAGCGDPAQSPDPVAQERATAIPTLSVSALPEPPMTNTVIADMRQSSLDAAAGQMQVWIDNDTPADLTPISITYRDPRFRSALSGDRLREIPGGASRGFPIVLPQRPACGDAVDAVPSADAPVGVIAVTYAAAAGATGERTEEIPVEDSTDVAGRYARARCLEIAIDRVVDVAWADEVTDGDPEQTPSGATGTLTLVLTPTGRGDGDLLIETVSGTPILSPVTGDAWRPGLRISGRDDPLRVDLPLKPTRCDAHAFQESGGATAFKIGLSLDGIPGQITLRMSPLGAANAITFARASCGLLSTASTG